MRVDDEDVYIPPRPKERSSFEWLGIITLAIVLGTFITDGIRLLAANAWMNYQFEQLAEELRSSRAEARQQAEVRREELRAQESERKMQSYECRFWWEQHQANPNAKNNAKKMQSCGE
ncbi:hypothetical protein [Pseudomonas subflava]|uniref:hypothetical protein n=1 Tax=Pseudomonas subflava TaxID=2952933 RepID=UPI002079FB6F|nr:hypothetical protein [Pseudomonas subflava]